MTTTTDDLSTRIAVLEERTKPKPPNLLSNLKDYGGIAALVISLLYSFPLGLWDRFVLGSRKEESAAVAALRESLMELHKLSARAGEIRTNGRDPGALEAALLGLSNQTLLILTNNDERYTQYRDRLSAEELVTIGLSYQYLNLIPESVKYFEFAQAKPAISPVMAIETERQIGKSYYVPSPKFNVQLGRQAYKNLLAKLSSGPQQNVGKAAYIQGEWAMLEMTTGDWKCGSDNLDAAISTLRPVQAMYDPNGYLMTTLEQGRSRYMRQANQPADGCG